MQWSASLSLSLLLFSFSLHHILLPLTTIPILMETWVSPFTNWLFPKQATKAQEGGQSVTGALDDRSHQALQKAHAHDPLHITPNIDQGKKPHHEHQPPQLLPTPSDPIKSEPLQPTAHDVEPDTSKVIITIIKRARQVVDYQPQMDKYFRKALTSHVCPY